MACRSEIGDFDLDNPECFDAYADELHVARWKLGLLASGTSIRATGNPEDWRVFLAARNQLEDLLANRPSTAYPLFDYLSVMAPPLVRDTVGYTALKYLQIFNPNRTERNFPGELAHIVGSVLRDPACLQYDTHNMVGWFVGHMIDRGYTTPPTPEYPIIAHAYNATHPDEPVPVM